MWHLIALLLTIALLRSPAADVRQSLNADTNRQISHIQGNGSLPLRFTARELQGIQSAIVITNYVSNLGLLEGYASFYNPTVSTQSVSVYEAFSMHLRLTDGIGRDIAALVFRTPDGTVFAHKPLLAATRVSLLPEITNSHKFHITLPKWFDLTPQVRYRAYFCYDLRLQGITNSALPIVRWSDDFTFVYSGRKHEYELYYIPDRF
jgi:hypothetical protein